MTPGSELRGIEQRRIRSSPTRRRPEYFVMISLKTIHTADADATRLDSFVSSASAVCIGHNGSEVIVLTNRQTYTQTNSTENNTTLSAQVIKICTLVF